MNSLGKKLPQQPKKFFRKPVKRNNKDSHEIKRR